MPSKMFNIRREPILWASSAISSNFVFGNTDNDLKTLSLINEAYVEMIMYDRLLSLPFNRSLNVIVSICSAHLEFLEQTRMTFLKLNFLHSSSHWPTSVIVGTRIIAL